MFLTLCTKMVCGSNLPKPAEITDTSILAGFNIWSGPGNFSIENGVKVPLIHDGSILWSQGVVSDPPKGLPQYEVSFYGRLPGERLMYVLVYRYDPTHKKGYIYLPGKGEKWYDVNVRSIFRGVEGNWFNASEEFDKTLDQIIRKAEGGCGKMKLYLFFCGKPRLLTASALCTI